MGHKKGVLQAWLTLCLQRINNEMLTSLSGTGVYTWAERLDWSIDSQLARCMDSQNFKCKSGHVLLFKKKSTYWQAFYYLGIIKLCWFISILSNVKGQRNCLKNFKFAVLEGCVVQTRKYSYKILIFQNGVNSISQWCRIFNKPINIDSNSYLIVFLNLIFH